MSKSASLVSEYRSIGIVTAIALISYCLWAFFVGMDVNWDLRNYHYYSGYRFWHGQMANNIYPAQVQTWLNPLIFAGIVGLMQVLSPVFVSLILAALQSLNAPLIFIICRQALQANDPQSSRQHKRGIATLATLIGVTSAVALSEVGTTFSDNILSLLVLSGVASLGNVALNVNSKKYLAWRWIGLSGLCVGAACGLKLTNLVFVPGFALLFLWLGTSVRDKFAGVSVFFVAFLGGVILTSGYRMWPLWEQTRNPLFPFLNGLFHSPWYDSTNYSDGRFRPTTYRDEILFIFRWAMGAHPGVENASADIRLAVVFVFLPILLWKRPKGWAAALLLFFISGMFMWLNIFAVQRYAVVLEMLSGVMMVIFISLVLRSFLQTGILLMVAAACLMTTQVPQWGRVGWSTDDTADNWFHVVVPDNLQKQEQLFVMLGGEPISYVIPFFPMDSRFVRLQGNFNPSPMTLLAAKRYQAITNHLGSLFSLSAAPPNKGQAQLLSTYSLYVTGDCIPVLTRVETLFACPLRR